MAISALSARRDDAAPPNKIAEAWQHYVRRDLRRAEALCKQLLKRQAGHAGALHLTALMARDRGKLDRARQLLEKSVAAAPENAAALCDLGNLLKVQGAFAEALACHTKVLGLMPESPLALGNLASAYTASGAPDKAIPLFRKALEFDPDEAELHYNLGNALLGMDESAEAIAAFETALMLKPVHAKAAANLGVALKDLGQLDAAANRFEQAIAEDPDNADGHWNLGLTMLAQGRYAEGWAEYEWRRRIPGFAMRHFRAPPWDGSALAGRTLLVHAEQGLGDALQFARYLAHLADLGGPVAFLCPPRLVPLLSEGLNAANVAIAAVPPDRIDVEAPLMSLPHLMGVPTPTGDAVPYLSPDSNRVGKWRPDRDDSYRIGICWQGNADYKADRRRSIPLRHFEPLVKMPDVEIISLQAGTGIEQIATVGWGGRLRAFPDEFDTDGAFVDTAALLPSLDLVLTSDTAVAHLAGAMGIETWLLLCHVPDWRWGLTGDATPWYPTMRLFRQDRPGDWENVFSQVARALQLRLRSR